MGFSHMDFLNSNVASAIVGGIIAIVAGDIMYRRQKRDDKKREMRENFKHKAELHTEKFFDARNKEVKKKQIIVCSYGPKLDRNGEVICALPKGIKETAKLEKEYVYLENIGETDINELEIAVMDSKGYVVYDKQYTGLSAQRIQFGNEYV